MDAGKFYIEFWEDVPYGIIYCIRRVDAVRVMANAINLWINNRKSYNQFVYGKHWQPYLNGWSHIEITDKLAEKFIQMRGGSLIEFTQIVITDDMI